MMRANTDGFKIRRRYTNKKEAKKTLIAYIDGAKTGTAGHFFEYPPTSYDDANFSLGNLSSILNEPLRGMYIHWPYCYLPNELQKCDFCCSNTKNDINSKKLRKQYHNAVIKEIESYTSIVKEKNIEWIYFGGGTPLTMTNSELEAIFSTLYSSRCITRETFITVESRPECISQDKLDILKRYGVKRISIGVESFDEKTAFIMGRTRQEEDYKKIVEKAIEHCRNFDMENINIDLIYGHPSDTLDSVIDSINYAISLSPDSIAAYPMGMPYGLTHIELKVQQGLPIKPLEFRSLCFNNINEQLLNNGYIHVYDCIWSKKKVDTFNSNRINGVANMWNQTCYLPIGVWIGIGVGSLGFIEDWGPIQNTNNIDEYINKINSGQLAIEKAVKFDADEMLRCEIVLSILHGTIDKERFKTKYNVNLYDLFELEFEILQELKLVCIDDDSIIITQEAIPYLQAISRFFFSKEVEVKLRETEGKRIDYRLYGINYSQLQ